MTMAVCAAENDIEVESSGSSYMYDVLLAASTHNQEKNKSKKNMLSLQPKNA